MTKKELLENIDFFCLGYFNGLFNNKFMDMNVSINTYLTKKQLSRFNNPKAKIRQEEIENLKNAKENLLDDKYLKSFQEFGKECGLKLRNSLSKSQINSLTKINNILQNECRYADGAIKKFFMKELQNNDIEKSLINAHKNLYNYLIDSAKVK